MFFNNKESALVTFEKDDYTAGSIKITVKDFSGDNTISSNYLEYPLKKYDREEKYHSQETPSSDDISISSNAYSNHSQNKYTGDIIRMSEFKPNNEIFFENSFEGINESNDNISMLNIYSIKSVSIKDTDGNNLNIFEDSKITLAFDGHSSLQDEIVPLWYYNKNQGKWIEEGYAERQPGGWYRSEVSHAATWAIAKPIQSDLGTYRGRIKYEDGTSAQDIRVQVLGDTWKGIDTSTDSDGYFEVKVAPGKSFRLKAYNYKDKYGVELATKIPGVSAGDIVENY